MKLQIPKIDVLQLLLDAKKIAITVIEVAKSPEAQRLFAAAMQAKRKFKTAR